MERSRRQVLEAIGGSVGIGAVIAAISSTASAEHGERGAPTEVTLSYDDELISEYQPSLVLDNVEPDPLAFHGLHAESSESTLNAVYGFTRYPYQSGQTSHDSHLGDHEPIIVWYDQTTGDVERVDYAAYHWFRGTASGDALEYVNDERRRPIFRVDPDYHHYYQASGGAVGTTIQRENLLESIDSWLNNGLEGSLALSQPYDPYAMLSRSTWWRHETMNWIDAFLKALWFNLGLSDATSTADVGRVNTW